MVILALYVHDMFNPTRRKTFDAIGDIIFTEQMNSNAKDWIISGDWNACCEKHPQRYKHLARNLGG